MSIKSHIIGIGGVFFKSENPKELQEWYTKQLGFTAQVPYMPGDDAITFKWKSWEDQPENTVWAPFASNTTYFNPSNKPFMINYIVQDLAGLLRKLKNSEIEIVGDIDHQPFGDFARILDPEGNKIEFWEPNREYFTDKY